MARPNRFRPGIEGLECRDLPAFIVEIGIDLDMDGNADDVRIVGDGKSSDLWIRDDGATLTFSLDRNGDGDYFDSGDFGFETLAVPDGSTVLQIEMGLGGDSIKYDMTGDLNQVDRTLSLKLGKGHDVFFMDCEDGFDVANSSNLDITVHGGAGSDSVGFRFDGVYQSTVKVTASLGGGTDTGSFATGEKDGAVDLGSLVEADYDLGAGRQYDQICTFRFQDIGVVSQAAVAVNLIGGDSAGPDVAGDNISLHAQGQIGNGVLPSTLSFHGDLLAGRDRFNCTMRGFALASQSTATIVVDGGAGSDQLKMEPDVFTDVITVAPQSLVDVQFIGGPGRDLIVVDVISTPIAADLLEMDGQFQVTILGGAGADDIYVEFHNTDTSSGNYVVQVAANEGDDLVFCDLRIGASTVTFDPLALFDGNEGRDTLVISGDPALLIHQSFENAN